MRYGRNVRLAVGLVAINAAALGFVAGTARGGADEVAPRGEIVIKPTGRKVRVVSIAGELPVRVQGAVVQPAQVQLASAQVTHRPAAMSLEPTTAPRVYRASMDDGADFGEQSVRLPYGSDPRENGYHGWGPVVHYPLYNSYPVIPDYGGFGYGSGPGYYGSGVYGPTYGYGSGRGYYGFLRSLGHSRRSGGWSMRGR
jgi:hypothetical protein